MNGFWIVGIAVNAIALVAVLAWAVRAWKQADRQRGEVPPPSPQKERR